MAPNGPRQAMKRERSRITAEVFFCGRYPSTLTLQVPLHGLACQEAVRSRSELRKNAERKVALLPRIQQALKDRLTDLAKHEHRSLNQQIEFLLEQALSDAAKKPQNDQPGGKGSHGKS